MIAESSATDAATTEARVVLLVWWGSVVPYKNHMIWARTRVLMYLASSWTTFEQESIIPLQLSFTGRNRFLRMFYGLFYEFYGRYTGFQTEISLQTQNTVVSFVCFSLRDCTLTYCHDDRAL